METSSTTYNLFVVLSSLASIYLLLLKIKEFFKESPDPKLTYATLKQFDSLQALFHASCHKFNSHFSALRLEMKADINQASTTIHNNAQLIASLKAQIYLFNQRINQLSDQSDKLLIASKSKSIHHD